MYLKLLSDFSLALVTFLGIIFALLQWRKNVKFKKAEYINELTEKIRTDSIIKKTVYKIDYFEKWYDENFHNSKELECEVDKTLSYFSYICYLKQFHLISRREFKFFIYEINRILVNPNVIDYFYNLFHFAKKNNACMSFEYLFKYGKKHRNFEKTFFDKNSYLSDTRYHHYLNF